MDYEHANPSDLSAEAALELEEIKRGQRAEAPALAALFRLLTIPTDAPPFQGQKSISMLDDVRSYRILSTALTSVRQKTPDYEHFQVVFREYVRQIEEGVAKKDVDILNEGKRFCLSLNRLLLSKRLNEIYDRRSRKSGLTQDYVTVF